MRLADLTREEMDPAQREVVDEAIAGKRGRIPGPLRIWLRSPEFGRHAQRLGAFLRYDTTLGPRRSELAILVTARAWTAQYEWFAHKREALKAGLDPAIVDAIASRQPPPFADPGDQVVYDYARALHGNHRVPQVLHDAAVATLGERGVVELIGLLGYYTLVAMTLNAFEFGLPEGERPELED
ncbi:MAG: carboxymuconolactone decarboxylase family protein [Acetobacteraceae bacterium]|nr:carboxymuconolactone decarboxylase family protein [Acetobacteraceae bacterium]